jgi:hypothetical protein
MAELFQSGGLTYLIFVVTGGYYVLLAERVGLAHFFSWGQ